jgi:hypothetical protein
MIPIKELRTRVLKNGLGYFANVFRLFGLIFCNVMTFSLSLVALNYIVETLGNNLLGDLATANLVLTVGNSILFVIALISIIATIIGLFTCEVKAVRYVYIAALAALAVITSAAGILILPWTVAIILLVVANVPWMYDLVKEFIKDMVFLRYAWDEYSEKRKAVTP